METIHILLISAILVAVILDIVLTLKNGRESNNGEIATIRTILSTLPESQKLQERTVREEISANRDELRRSLAESRAEIAVSFKNLSDMTAKNLETFSIALGQFTAKTDERFHVLNSTTENRLNSIRETLDKKLQHLHEENSKKLEEMRKTVDEKLQESVEKRFNDSFKLISERLEMVQKGLGEMQTLATGVGDLKRVLTNVKTRGNLGEIQLANILEQCLTAEQYTVNAQVKEGSGERVEFAVKMPGKSPDSPAVLLPIDSKFPVEDYQRLLDSYDNAPMPEELKKINTAFENSVKTCASDIHNKYINPPVTTDFAVMFVPTEGLYAEILRRPGLFEKLQRELKIVVVGPTNLMAFLTSLQMGFRTLAIEKRSSEVWNLLSAVKTEFGKFGAVLDKTREHLERAVKDIDAAGVRTRAIEKQLRGVETLPVDEAAKLLD